MKQYHVAPEAEDDLRQIWRYLFGKAGLSVADRIQSELLDAFEGLAVVYRRAATQEIVAVLHGKRNVKRLLKIRLPT